jgi:hypothetical protein
MTKGTFCVTETGDKSERVLLGLFYKITCTNAYLLNQIHEAFSLI